jgi:hypothetical protein
MEGQDEVERATQHDEDRDEAHDEPDSFGVLSVG